MTDACPSCGQDPADDLPNHPPELTDTGDPVCLVRVYEWCEHCGYEMFVGPSGYAHEDCPGCDPHESLFFRREIEREMVA